MTPLDYAISQIGVVEERGNRGVPFTRYAFQGEEPGPWCARGLRWCFIQAHTPLPGNRWLIGNVAELLDALTDRGAVLPAHATLEPGDLGFMKTREGSDAGSGMHVFIVQSIGGLTVNSIDFNWSDSVMRVARERTSPKIAGFARWPVRPTA